MTKISDELLGTLINEAKNEGWDDLALVLTELQSLRAQGGVSSASALRLVSLGMGLFGYMDMTTEGAKEEWAKWSEHATKVQNAATASLEASPRDEIEGRVDIIEQSETPDGGTALTLRQYDQETVAVVYFPPLFGPREPAPVSEEMVLMPRALDGVALHRLANYLGYTPEETDELYSEIVSRAALAAKGGQ